MFSPLVGRADPGQLRVDGGAVVALLVVLDDHLPVGGELVGVPGDDGEILRPVGTDDVLQPCDVRAEFDVLGAGVDEQPAVEVHQRELGEPELARVEPLDSAEPRRIAQRAVQPIGPRMVGAHDGSALGRRIARQQFVSAVSAGVGKRPNRAVVAAHQQDCVGSAADRLLGAHRGEVAGVGDAGPPGEDVLLFPVEHRRIHIGLPRQHPRLTERGQCRGQAVGGNRSRTVLFEHTVSLVPEVGSGPLSGSQCAVRGCDEIATTARRRGSRHTPLKSRVRGATRAYISPAKAPMPRSAVVTSLRVIRRNTRYPTVTAASAVSSSSVASALSAGVGAPRAVL